MDPIRWDRMEGRMVDEDATMKTGVTDQTEPKRGWKSQP